MVDEGTLAMGAGMEGTSTRGAGVEWDNEEGPEAGSTEVEGADTERGVSIGLGTIGSGEEIERNEGSIEETKL